MNVQKINWPNALRDLSGHLDEVTERAEKAEARVEELEEGYLGADSMTLLQERDGWQRLCVKVTEERDDLRAENERLRGELAEMAEDYTHSVSIAGNTQMENDLLRTAVPRVIGTDEVRVGQKVVFSNHNNENDWIVDVVDWETRFASDYNGTIVLLAEDPEDADDDFPCCRIKQTGICEAAG